MKRLARRLAWWTMGYSVALLASIPVLFVITQAFFCIAVHLILNVEIQHEFLLISS
jgi:hypothetical protein